jgi:hypothetical protein
VSPQLKDQPDDNAAAVAAWNRRAPDLATALRERDALRAILRDYVDVDMGTGIRPRAAALLDEIAARAGKP